MSDASTDRMTGETEEGLPLCYDDRHSTAFTHLDRYVFISYSHNDKDAVYADLKQLYGAGLHFWYDKKLRVGDFWDKRVEERIKSEQCIGALLFTGVNTVKSEAVEQELKLCQERVERAEQDGTIFKLIPVTLNGGSILRAVKEAFLSCADLNEKELAAVLPQERVKTVLDTLSERLLYIGRSADGSHIPKIIQELKQCENDTGYKLFCGSEEIQKQFERLPNVELSGGRRLIQVGEYPQEREEEDSFYFREGIYKTKNAKLNVLGDGRAYRFSPLKWQIVRFGEDKLTAVTEKVIDCCRADEIASFIRQIRKVVFEDDSMIEDIRLIDLGLIREFGNVLTRWEATDYAKKENKFDFLPMYWGANAGNSPVLFYWESGVKIMGKAPRDQYAGIRLVADFKTDTLLNYFEKENLLWNR